MRRFYCGFSEAELEICRQKAGDNTQPVREAANELVLRNRECFSDNNSTKLFETVLRSPANYDSLLLPISVEKFIRAKYFYFAVMTGPGSQVPVLQYNEAKARLRQIDFSRKPLRVNAPSGNGSPNHPGRRVSSNVQLPATSASFVTTVNSIGFNGRLDAIANYSAIIDSQCEARRTAVSRWHSFKENVLWNGLRPLELARMLVNNGFYLLSQRDQFMLKLSTFTRLEQLATVPDDYEQQPGPKQLKVRCAFCKRVLEVPFTTSFGLAQDAEEPSNPSLESIMSQLAKEKLTAQWYIDKASNWATLYAVASNVRLQHERKSPSCPIVVNVNADDVRLAEVDRERLEVYEEAEHDQFYKRAQVNCKTHCQQFYILKGDTEADSNTKAAAYWTAAHGDHETTLSESSVTRAAEDAYLWTSYKFLPTGAYNDGLLLCSDDVSQLGSYIEYEMSGKRRLGDPTKVYNDDLTAVDCDKPVTVTIYDDFPDIIYDNEQQEDSSQPLGTQFGAVESLRVRQARTKCAIINRCDEEMNNGYDSLLERFANDKPCYAPFISKEMRLETFETGVQIDSKCIELRDYLALVQIERKILKKANSRRSSTSLASHDRERASSPQSSCELSTLVSSKRADEHFGPENDSSDADSDDKGQDDSDSNSEQSDYDDDNSDAGGEGDQLSLDELRRRMGNTDWSADRRGLFERLADAGFLSLRRSEAELRDVCVCFWCGLAIGGWYEEADAFIEHARHQSTEDACAYLFFQRGRQFIIEARQNFPIALARTRRIELCNVEEVVDADASRLLYELGFYERSPGSGSAVASSSRPAEDENGTTMAVRASATTPDPNAPDNANIVSASASRVARSEHSANGQQGENGRQQQAAVTSEDSVPLASSASASVSSTRGSETEIRYDPVVSFHSSLAFRVEEREIRARKDLRSVRNLVFLCGVQPPIVAFAMERQLKASLNDFVNMRQFLEALWDIDARMRSARLTDFIQFQRIFNEANIRMLENSEDGQYITNSNNVEESNAESNIANLDALSHLAAKCVANFPNTTQDLASQAVNVSRSHEGGAQRLATDGQKLCVWCLRSSVGIVFVPCGHTVVCTNCAASRPLKQCPQCSKPVSWMMRIYL